MFRLRRREGRRLVELLERPNYYMQTAAGHARGGTVSWPGIGARPCTGVRRSLYWSKRRSAISASPRTIPFQFDEDIPMKRVLLSAVIAVSLGFAAVAHAQNTIRIGLSGAFTGPAALASEWEKWGVDLAVDEINAAGGLLG